MLTPTRRPIYINLLRIELPIAGLVSIAHRVSGVWLALALPFVLYLLEQGLSGPAGFATASAWLSHPLVLLALVPLGWGLVHHTLAGLRYLALDLGLGLELRQARRSAWIVWWLGLVAAAGIVLLVGRALL